MAVAMQWLAYYCVLAMRTPPAAFGSALISSIYGIVDMAMVGQYRAPTARRRSRGSG